VAIMKIGLTLTAVHCCLGNPRSRSIAFPTRGLTQFHLGSAGSVFPSGHKPQREAPSLALLPSHEQSGVKL
jgi:hypothetical protein